MRTDRALAALAALGLLIPAGCGDSGSGPSSGGGGDNSIQATFSGIPESSTYSGDLELWISFAKARGFRHSTSAPAGKFHIVNGQAVDLSGQPMTFAVDTSDPDVPLKDGNILWQLAVDAFVTIEPADDPAPADPGAAFLAGTFLNGTTLLTVSGSDALNDDFGTISGSAMLATPSTSDSTDETEGCWFVLPGPNPAASLTLPTLSVNPPQSKWTYEAWISLPSAGLASLGTFKTPLLPDTDMDGPLHGVPPTDGPGYAFPGSDFPYGSAGVDLSLGSVVITLEPVPDNDPATPFFLELLGGPLPANPSPGVSYPLSIQTHTFPTGTVTVPTGS